MFPLGSLLLPGMAMPLQIFEPRYRELMKICVANQTEFGVVLITRGSEVGGGETRYDVGCLAQVRNAVRFDDGRWRVICVGTSRLRVTKWLADDPYPLADVEIMVEPPPDPDDVEHLDDLVGLFRSTLSVANGLGLSTVPATVSLPIEPMARAWKVCELGPFGDQDRLKVLRTVGFGDRIHVLKQLIGDINDQLKLELKQPPG